MFIAMFKISIKAIKFEDITVTFHPIKPNKPIIIITEVAQPNNGINTHFMFLKMNQRVKIIKRRSDFNFFVFHFSSSVMQKIRNIFLKFLVKRKGFINSYLGTVYKN